MNRNIIVSAGGSRQSGALTIYKCRVENLVQGCHVVTIETVSRGERIKTA